MLYAAGAAFLAWIAYGNGLKTLVGGVLADWFLEGPEPTSDETLERVAKIGIVVWSIVFLVGLVFPGIRGWSYS